MKNYTADQILDCLDYVEDLETMQTEEFCAELNLRQSIKYKNPAERTKEITDYVIKTYGHDMLIHILNDEKIKRTYHQKIKKREIDTKLEIKRILSQLGMGTTFS